MKKATLPLAVFVAILGCVLAVSANVTTMQIHDQLKQERFYRLQTESQLQRVLTDNESLKTQVAQADNDLESIRNILDKGNNEKSDLKTQLMQISGERDVLLKQLEDLKSGIQDQAGAPEAAQPANTTL